MIEYIVMGGPYALLLVLFGAIIFALIVKKAIDLFARTELGPANVRDDLVPIARADRAEAGTSVKAPDSGSAIKGPIRCRGHLRTRR